MRGGLGRGWNPGTRFFHPSLTLPLKGRGPQNSMIRPHGRRLANELTSKPETAWLHEASAYLRRRLDQGRICPSRPKARNSRPTSGYLDHRERRSPLRDLPYVQVFGKKFRVTPRARRGPSRRGPRRKRIAFGSPHFLGTFCSRAPPQRSLPCSPRLSLNRRKPSGAVRKTSSGCGKFDGKNRRNYDGPMVT